MGSLPQKTYYLRRKVHRISASKLCVGCMSFGQAGSMHAWSLDEKKSEEIIHHALDLGTISLIPPIVIPAERVKNTLAERCAMRRRVIRLLLHPRCTLMREDCLKTPLCGRWKARCVDWARTIWICISSIGLTTTHRWRRQWKRWTRW